MRTLDDFACLKEAGFEKIYSRIDNAITHYNDDDVPTYCAKFRLALDLVVSAVRSIAQIDKSLLHGTTGTKIGTFKLLLPEPIYKDYGWQLLTELNEVTKHYHHEDEDSEEGLSDYPPREQWNTDAEKCYELMRKISDWLIFFKREMTDYVAHNKPDYKQILKDKKAAYREDATSNTIANSEKPEFFEKCMVTLDLEKQYREGLMSDLVTVEKDIIITNQENYETLIDILDSSSQYKETEPFLYIREIRERLIKLLASRQVYTYFSVLHPIVFRETWSPDEIADAPFSGANLSMEDIHYGLKHIIRYASANIIRKLSCHDLTKKRFLEVLYDNSSGAVKSFYGVVKELSPEDIKVLDNIGNFRRYLYQRDCLLIYTAKEQVMAIDDRDAPEFYSAVSKIADDFKAAIMAIVSELFAATTKEDWQSFYDFEKKYVAGLLDSIEVEPFLRELKEKQAKEDAWNALSDRQKYIEELQRAIESGKELYCEKVLPNDLCIDVTYEDVKKVVSFAKENGFINAGDKEDVVFFKSIILCSGLCLERKCNHRETYLEDLRIVAKEAVERGIFDYNDSNFFGKALAIKRLINRIHSRKYSLEQAKKAIAESIRLKLFPCWRIHMDGRISDTFTYLSFCLLAILSGIQYIALNYPLGLYKHICRFIDRDIDDFKYFRVQSISVLFEFVKKMTSFGRHRLFVDLQCPFYCEEELLNAIETNDQETFKNICRSEKLTLVDDLAIIVGFYITTIESPLAILLKLFTIEDDDEEEAPQIFNTISAPIMNTLGISMSSIMSFFPKECIKDYMPDVSDDEDLEICSYIVSALYSVLFYLEIMGEDEAVMIRKYLEVPSLNGLLKIAQLKYYEVFNKLPENIKSLISEEELKKHTRKNVHEQEACLKHDSLSGPSIVNYSYALPEELFSGPVDISNVYLPGLRNELKNKDVFEPLFTFILQLGGITSDDEAGALLRAFTGFPVNNANLKAKWEADYHILYYLVKYMFTPKKSYVSMSQCIDIYYPSDEERRKAEKSPSSYAERIGGDNAPYIIETLSRLSSVFPRPETPIAD